MAMQRQRKKRPNGDARKVSSQPAKQDRKEKRKLENEKIDALQRAVGELDLKAALTKFDELPLSQATAAGIRDSYFDTLTDIQAKAIPAGLQGSDILGAAKTGSGKTLAFLVPVLEKLYRERWTQYDGLGALIISPTRELSLQIFEVLRKIGRYHKFSAGIVIGGMDLEEEAKHIGQMNILVCTPGRMVQHMGRSSSLDLDNLQILVLDEADRIMDLGFKNEVDALVSYLPSARQTLLFSATQTRKVSDLARLSLKDPEYISVHEAAAVATPAKLQQFYILLPLAEKIDTLWSFLQSNKKKKSIVFFSSGKQVRFVYEAFRHMQPGISLLHMHGRQKQAARQQIIRNFSNANAACLFATDVVARGVDIPMVDWVVQVDCPEDADTYIHRSGRTARYDSEGKALLFLEPSEKEGMLKRLEQKKVPILERKVPQKKRQSVREELSKVLLEHDEAKYLAHKAFVSYVRSVQQQRDTEIFQLDKLNLDDFAASLGLGSAPKMNLAKFQDLKKVKNRSRQAAEAALNETDESDDGEDDEGSSDASPAKKKEAVRSQAQKMFERKNQTVMMPHYTELVNSEHSNDNVDPEGDDFFNRERVLPMHPLAADDGENPAGSSGTKVLNLGGKELVLDSKRREKLLQSKKKLLKYKGTGTKTVFDDDGNATQAYQLQDEEGFQKKGDAEDQRRDFTEAEAALVQEADVEDKAEAKEKRRAKRLKQKLREREDEDERHGRAASQDYEYEGGETGGSGVQFGEDGDDGLALLRSLPLAGDSGDEEPTPRQEKSKKTKKTKKRALAGDDDDGSEADERPQTKKKQRRVIEVDSVPTNLEDLESLAAGLLGS